VPVDDSISRAPPCSTPFFAPSTVFSSGVERLDPSIRDSHKARVPRSHAVQCIEARARGFQGWRPFVFVERLWAQRYGPGGHYAYHFDWSSASSRMGRISSFMVWLGDACTGGGTHFPRLRKPSGAEWCRFVECGGEEREGVVFKPVKGNAVYWENFRPDGQGYEESWHAGLPVLSGEKIGLNIWNWFQDGYVPAEERTQEPEPEQTQEQGQGAREKTD
jgi:prolyl 4-hydroxylase